MKEAQHVLEASDIYKKFRELLNEMFQMNNADLDFGLYRIMNARRKEINRFLNEELLSQIDKVFEECIEVDKKRLEEELQKAIQKAKELGLENPEEVPQVKKIKEQLKHAIDVTTTKIDVFSHLTTFFSRYYQDGDFVSLRRYKWDKYTYAIPYNGEEVKLYWANYDQYYIKTSEYFREYSFFVEFPDGKKGKVYFKVKDADSEKDNVKGKERFFIFKDLEIKDDELFVYFDYMPVEEKKKNLQQELNKETVKKILNFEKLTKDWKFVLSKEEKVKKSNNKKTILEKHINKYTAKNKFDFFIHKDLGGFLKRELDFYIKNEVVDLYEFQNFPPDKVKEYLCKVKAIKLIGEKIIDFLAQLENFQKKLWLKKKFIWETQYCITLDRIFAIEDKERREWLLERILSNKDQIEEWKTLYHVHELDEAPLFRSAWDNPSPENLRKLIESDSRLRYLVVDTRHFDEEFKLKLISSFDNLDEELDGLLVHGENFQALNLLLERYRGEVQCIYIDPPFNTGKDFLFKDNYQDSTWLTLMENRLKISKNFLKEDGTLYLHLDHIAEHYGKLILDSIFGEDNFLSKITWNTGENISGFKSQAMNWIRQADFIHFYSKSKNFKFNKVYELLNQNNKYGWLDILGKDKENLFIEVWENGKLIRKKVDEKVKPKGTIWNDIYSFQYSEPRITESIAFVSNQKPENLLRRIIQSSSDPGDIIMDFFVGSGTTTAVAHKLNRKWIGVEIGEFFNEIYIDEVEVKNSQLEMINEDAIISVVKEKKDSKVLKIRKLGLLGRMKIVLYGDREFYAIHSKQKRTPHLSKDINWQGGGFFKYIRLESYEDILNNLQPLNEDEFEKTQKILSSQNPSLREDFMLHYWIDFETKDSPSLLNVDTFKDPWKYELYIATDTINESKKVPVDLVETFNYLIGLKVEHISEKEHVTAEFERDEYGKLKIKGRLRRCAPGEGWTFQTVEGTLRDGRKVLIVWRTLTDDLEKDNTVLEAYFKTKEWNTRDSEYDLVYVNGMHTLENILNKDEDDKDAPLYKVQQIELEFKSRMFEVEDM